MSAKLPPMLPRVVAAEEFRDPRRREQVFAALATLDESRVLEEVDRFLEVECGALARQDATLPASVKKAARFALNVHGMLHHAVSGAGMWKVMREAQASAAERLERDVVELVERLMFMVFEGQSTFDREARMSVAGIGGCDLAALRPFRATSGFEAVVNLADDVRRAVRGVSSNPFARFVTSKKASARRRQTGREKPTCPAETASDDVAILRAMADGVVGKIVAGRSGEYGHPCSDSHVRKRRIDLRRWGWITSGRHATLTDEGRKWLSEVPGRRGTTGQGTADGSSDSRRVERERGRRTSGPKDAR